MLLKFSVSNYKSFLEEATLQMVPTPKQKDLQYSLITTETKRGKKVKALCSSVIYGPNAAGKTNIIGAIQTLQTIITRGNIRNSPEPGDINLAMDNLELIPNNKLGKNKTVNFAISFVSDKRVIDYSLNLDLGNFLDVDYSRKIVFESLTIDNERVFERKLNRVNINESFLFKAIGASKPSTGTKFLMMVIDQSIKNDEIFLSNGFKNIINNDLATQIINWFSEKLVIIYRADRIKVTREFPENKNLVEDHYLTRLAQTFGAASDQIVFYTSEDGKAPRLSSVIKDGSNKKKNYILPVEALESYGTTRFLNLFPMIIRTFLNGGTILIDEFDASIHPMALLNIVNIFHNDELNKMNAQLIFNTHNPIFLKPSVFRRDEIKFVERDDNGLSTIYSLADFGTSGETGVRKTTDYMKNYFINQYGAIKDIDFSAFFEEFMVTNNDKKKD